jgi:transposase
MMKLPWVKNKRPRCSNCGATEDADVIGAFGLCERCVNREAVDGLMRNLLWKRPRFIQQRELPTKVLIDYLHDPATY